MLHLVNSISVRVIDNMQVPCGSHHTPTRLNMKRDCYRACGNRKHVRIRSSYLHAVCCKFSASDFHVPHVSVQIPKNKDLQRHAIRHSYTH